jgi:hypothetical protein
MIYDIIGSIIGIAIIVSFMSPVFLFFYLIHTAKVDVDNDGIQDVPYRWEKE